MEIRNIKSIFGWSLISVVTVGWILFFFFGTSVAQILHEAYGAYPVDYFQRLVEVWLEKCSLYACFVVLFLWIPINVKVVTLSLFLSLAVVEMGLAGQNFYLDHQYPQSQLGLGLWEYDPVLGWKQRANTEAIYAKKRDRFRTRVKINSKGLRDDEYAYEKKPGVFRILLLGDSVIAGLEVKKEEVLDTQLEHLLEKDGRYEVINAGVSGYGTDQSYLFLKNEGYKYHPDIIIYAAVFNDPVENMTIHQRQRAQGKSYFEIEPDDKLVLKGVPVPRFTMEDPWVMVLPEAEHYYSGKMEEEFEAQQLPSLLESIKKDLSNLHFYQWIRFRVKQGGMLENWLTQSGLKEQESTEMKQPDSVAAYQYRITKRLLKEMKSFSESLGAKFLVYEFTNGVGEMPARPTDTERMCQELGIPTIDLFKPFYGISNGKKVFCHLKDAHWNAKGHQLASETIYRYLKEENWV